jgi:hypothetical protein
MRRRTYCWLATAAIFLITGIPMLAVGCTRSQCDRTTCLFSIPFCPTAVFPPGSTPPAGYGTQYISAVRADQSSLCPLPAGAFNVSLPLPASSLTAQNEQTVHLLHNLYRYNFTIRICHSPSTCPPDGFSAQLARNTNISDPSDAHWNATFGLEDLPTVFQIKGRIPVACPLGSPATDDFDAACKSQGYPTLIAWPLQDLKIGPFNYESMSDMVYVVFSDFVATTPTFMDVPQMYFVSWEKTNANGMIAGGAVFTGLRGLCALFPFVFFILGSAL